MTELASAPVHLERRWTFNKLASLSRPQRAAVIRGVRKRAAMSWDDVEPPSWRDDGVVYEVRTAWRDAAMPDTDGIAWMAKAMLDGAVDAGIIGDDSPDIVARVVLHRPVRWPTLDSAGVVYGIFKPAVQ